MGRRAIRRRHSALRASVLLSMLAAVACAGSRATLTASAPEKAAVELEPEPAVVVPYSITISGGLSLGAYEAGMNWALVEWMRHRYLGKEGAAPPKLNGVSGASAGAINAVFTAVRWCEDRSILTSVDKNVFEQTWRRVGFETMLPLDDEDYAGIGDPEWDPDFLISRKKAFDDVVKDLRTRLDSTIYRPGCEVPITLIVTRIKPGRVQVGTLEARTQRYVVPLLAKSGADGSLGFFLNEALAETADQRLVGNLLWLVPRDSERPEGPKGAKLRRIDRDVVIDTLLASSAHPSSFGPVLLPHCAPQAGCKGTWNQSQTCTVLGKELARAKPSDPYGECIEPFNDGGAFDNVPLGIAVAQVERATAAPAGDKAASRSLPPRYVYMDPAQRRLPATYAATCSDEGEASTSQSRDPTREIYQFIGGFLGSAFDYELQSTLRYLQWDTSAVRLVDDVAQLFPGVGSLRPDAVALDALEVAMAGPTRLAGVDFDSWKASRKKLANDICKHIPRADYRPRDPCDPKDDTFIATQASLPAADKREPPLDAVLYRVRTWRESPNEARSLRIPTRFSPITATMLGHFAAFIDRPFRDYDYYAGVYDALHTIAAWECPDCSWTDRKGQIGKLVAMLGFDGARGSVANDVVTRLQVMEGAASHGERARSVQRDSMVSRVQSALTDGDRCAGTSGGETCLRDCGFDGFVSALAARDYASERGSLAAEILSRGDDWSVPLGVRVAERLERLSERLEAPSKALGYARVAGGIIAYHFYFQSRNSWFEPPSSARSWYTRMLAPYAVLSGNDERKFDLGLLAYGACYGWACLVSDTSLRIGWLPGHDSTGALESDRGHWSLDAHGGVRVRLPGWVLSSVQLRAGYSLFSLGVDLPHRASVELDLGLLLDRFRIGIGCNALREAAENGTCDDSLYILFGLNDLAGTINHLW
jgi:hypothetical protein